METVAFVPSRRQLQRLALIGVLFVVAGVVMVFDDYLVLGLAVLVFFGPVAVVHLVRLRNPKPLLELTATGLRPHGGGLVPWQDIEDAGVGVLGRAGPVVGIRLSDYLGYVRSVSVDMPGWKRLLTGAGAFFVASPPPQAENLTRVERRMMMLLAFNRRKTGGWDISWLQRLFPDSPEAVIQQILTYRMNALNR